MSNTTPEKRMLDAQDIRREYGIGRNTVYALLAKLPVVKLGKRRLLLRSDLESFLSEAARSGTNILEYLNKEKPAR